MLPVLKEGTSKLVEMELLTKISMQTCCLLFFGNPRKKAREEGKYYYSEVK